MTEPPALIVGLGNPGREHAAHRHNVGYRVVETLARAHSLTFTRRKLARAYVAEGRVLGRDVLLAKPVTFMNLSGRAVGRLAEAHHVPHGRILVVYDDLDLDLGRLRLRPDGGSGGHRGMRSIIERLGTQSFPRLRVGIDRPPPQVDPADYVLQPFDPTQAQLLPRVLASAQAAVECWLTDGIQIAMDRFNRTPPASGPGDEAPAAGSPCPEGR